MSDSKVGWAKRSVPNMFSVIIVGHAALCPTYAKCIGKGERKC